MAAEQLSPRGPERTDLGFAMLAALTANCHRDRKRRPRAYQIADFLLRFDEGDHQPATDEEVRAFMTAITQAMGGKVNGNDRQPGGDAQGER